MTAAEELQDLRNVLTCAIMTAKVRHLLSSATLDQVLAELEKWAKDNGHWTEAKRSNKLNIATPAQEQSQ